MFNRTRFVFVEPSHPGNIGAAARALKTMGFTRLVLVRPRTPLEREEVSLMRGIAKAILKRGKLSAH